MEETEVKKEIKKRWGGEKQGYKKKSLGGAKFNRKQQSSNADEYFDGYCFCVGKVGSGNVREDHWEIGSVCEYTFQEWVWHKKNA